MWSQVPKKKKKEESITLLTDLSILYSMLHKFTNLINWNFSGISNGDTFNYIQDLVRTNNPSILFISETWTIIAKFALKVQKKWNQFAALGPFRWIIVMWLKSSSFVTPFRLSRSILHLIITFQVNKSWVISTIYNERVIKDQNWAR